LLTIGVGIPIGVMAANHKRGALDRLITFVAVAGASIPVFWLALLAQLLFFAWLGWLPLGGRLDRLVAITHPVHVITGFQLIDAAVTGNWVAWRSAAAHLVLPVCVLATYPMSLCIRMTRAAMIETLSEPFILRARAAGLRNHTILLGHALPNALLPTISVLGLSFAYSITGSFLTELIFSWPGIGRYMTDAIIGLDFPVILAITLIVTVVYVIVNLVVDLLQAILDPRLRWSAA
jgi:peptide/nickel transport system permease protein